MPTDRKSRDFQLIMNYLLKTNLKEILKEYGEEDFQLTFTIYNIAKKVYYRKLVKGEIVFRIGDQGDKFYLILRGSVSILKLLDMEIYCTLEEYLRLLLKLKNDKEMYITEHIITLNKKKIPVEYEKIEEAIDVIFRKKLLKYLKLNYTSEEIKSLYAAYKKTIDEYHINFQEFKKYEDAAKKNFISETFRNSYKNQLISKLLKLDINDVKNCSFDYLCDLIDGGFKINLEELEEKSIFIISKYEHFSLLSTGQYFGDFAIDCNVPRSATIMGLDEETHLAVIDKECYREFILKHKLKIEEKKLNFLYKSFFNRFINKFYFEKKYYACCIYQEFTKGHILFKENENLDYVYILHSGKINLEFKRNYYFLVKKINEILALDPRIKKLYDEQNKKIDRENTIIFDLLNNIYNIKNNITTNPTADNGNLLTSLLNNDQKKIDELNKIKHLSIAKISNQEILGLENFIFKLPTQYKATVMSEKLCCYIINFRDLEKIKASEAEASQVIGDISVKKLFSFIMRLVELSKSFVDTMKIQELFNKKSSLAQGQALNVGNIPSKPSIKKTSVLNIDNYNRLSSRNDFETIAFDDEKEKQITSPIKKMKTIKDNSNKNLDTLFVSKLEKIAENENDNNRNISELNDTYFKKGDFSLLKKNKKRGSINKNYSDTSIAPSLTRKNLFKKNLSNNFKNKEPNNRANQAKSNNTNPDDEDKKLFNSIDFPSESLKASRSERLKRFIFNRKSTKTIWTSQIADNKENSLVKKNKKLNFFLCSLDNHKQKTKTMENQNEPKKAEKNSLEINQKESLNANKNNVDNTISNETNTIETNLLAEKNEGLKDEIKDNPHSKTDLNKKTPEGNIIPNGNNIDNANIMSNSHPNLNVNVLKNINTKISSNLNMNKVNIVKMIEKNYDIFKHKYLKIHNKTLDIETAPKDAIDEKTKNLRNKTISEIQVKYNPDMGIVKENSNNNISESHEDKADITINTNINTNTNYTNMNNMTNSNLNFNLNKSQINNTFLNKTIQIKNRKFSTQTNLGDNDRVENFTEGNKCDKNVQNSICFEYERSSEKNASRKDKIRAVSSDIKNDEHKEFPTNTNKIYNSPGIKNFADDSKYAKQLRKNSLISSINNNNINAFNEFNLLDLENPYQNINLSNGFINSDLYTNKESKASESASNAHAPNLTKKSFYLRKNIHKKNNSKLKSLFLSNLGSSIHNSPLDKQLNTERTPNKKTLNELKSKVFNYKNFLKENKLNFLNMNYINKTEHDIYLNSSTINFKMLFNKDLKTLKNYSQENRKKFSDKSTDTSNVYYQEINLKGNFEFPSSSNNNNENSDHQIFKRALKHDIKALKFKKSIKKNSIISKNS